MTKSYHNKLVRIETEHSIELKILFDVLKEILNDVNINFIGSKPGDVDNKSAGIKIAAVDLQQTLYIYVKLDASSFCDFYVKKPMTIGIDVKELYKFMKTIDKESRFVMSIDKDAPNEINFDLFNKERDTHYTQSLLDIDESNNKIKQADFEIAVTMKTAKFKKVCAEMSQFSEQIEIVCTCEKIAFKCMADRSKMSQIYYKKKDADEPNDKDTGVYIKHNGNENNVIQGIYNLKNLVTLGRCANLCDYMTISLKNSFPMFITYPIEPLGKMHVGLVPAQPSSEKGHKK